MNLDGWGSNSALTFTQYETWDTLYSLSLLLVYSFVKNDGGDDDDVDDDDDDVVVVLAVVVFTRLDWIAVWAKWIKACEALRTTAERKASVSAS